LLLALSLVFVACNGAKEQNPASTDELTEQEVGSDQDAATEQDEAQSEFSWKAYFIGREAEQISLLVNGAAEDFRGPLLVNLTEEQAKAAADYKLGDSLEIVHDGAMMMSYPGQINAQSIKLLSGEEALPQLVKMDINEMLQAVPVFADQAKLFVIDAKLDAVPQLANASELSEAEVEAKAEELKDSETVILLCADTAEASAAAAEKFSAAGAPLVIDLGAVSEIEVQK
ncbi:MAG: hypothetical protein Q4P08_04660, partial [Eubacteriales bacterium]|nr:hypothetical protein [Eubacteriales bacterium]